MKTLTLYVSFLILSSGCATQPRDFPRMEGHWHIIEVVPGERAACIPLQDLEKIKERLVRCEGVD